MDFRCVHCGFKENCKAVADEYIECEIMILLIDLILHKLEAYRHLLYNMLSRETVNLEGIMWKSSFSFLLLDACRQLLLNKSKDDWGSSASSLSSIWVSIKMLSNVFIGNFIFSCVLLFGTTVLQKSSSELISYKQVFLAILVSSYFKIFLIAMMVWEFPFSVLFIIDIFVLSSNAMALKVLTRSTTMGCMSVCFAAHATKFLATHGRVVPESGFLRYFNFTES